MTLKIVPLAPSRWSLVGELDIAEVPKLEAQLEACDGDVTLDCSGLTFVDSSGLSFFVRLRNECEARGKKLTLTEPAPSVLRVLSITGLDSVLLRGIDVSSQ